MHHTYSRYRPPEDRESHRKHVVCIACNYEHRNSQPTEMRLQPVDYPVAGHDLFLVTQPGHKTIEFDGGEWLAR